MFPLTIYHHAGALGRTVIQVIRKRLKQRGDSSSWTTLRRILEGQQRVTVTFRRGDGRTLHVRKATRAETDQKAIYDALGMDPAPGGVRKMIVPLYAFECHLRHLQPPGPNQVDLGYHPAEGAPDGPPSPST